jgi:hypothetical protein
MPISKSLIYKRFILMSAEETLPHSGLRRKRGNAVSAWPTAESLRLKATDKGAGLKAQRENARGMADSGVCRAKHSERGRLLRNIETESQGEGKAAAGA